MALDDMDSGDGNNNVHCPGEQGGGAPEVHRVHPVPGLPEEEAGGPAQLPAQGGDDNPDIGN